MSDPSAVARLAADHLWQSTLVAGVAVGLAWSLRKSEARFRHATWMLASLKFLVPFALLEQIGQRIATRRVFEAPSSAVVTTVMDIGKPFSGLPAATAQHAAAAGHFPWLLCIVLLWAAGAVAVVLTWLVRMARVRRLVKLAVPQHEGREVEMLRATESIVGLRRPLPLLLSKDCMEPGVFGIFRPVLLWPEGISAHLDDAQVSAIVAHEVWHVRRRDNLLALLHMCVEAAFWFHPLVWWMGARLLEERERSCDEAVLQIGNEPAQYADAILKACRFCVESPLTCVSGVSGSDLKRRMVQIMNAATIPLSRSRKMLLAGVAVAAVACPIALGLLNPSVVKADEAQQFSALKFDSVSLTPTQGDNSNTFFMLHDKEFVSKSITLKSLIATAYGVRPDRIVGGPDWINTQRFDFEARWTPTAETTSEIPPPGAPPAPAHTMSKVMFATAGPGHAPGATQIPAPAALQAMLRNFLVERVGLRVRGDSAVLPVYELVVANGGSKLTPTRDPEPSNVTHVEMKARVEDRVQDNQHSYSIINGVPQVLCDSLSRQLGHEVVDKTGLTGRYDFELSFSSAADPGQLASTLRDQYGLDLQSTQQAVKVFAVDSVEMPQN
ncbi:M56 family metallopeptidase [Occallatibacter riparius]|uniref:M56 family metallopeptidase n=1 Tax=Occallatibacter riparius TaxID=1002689 RepID=A0A9J7BLU8_9BACT|nr:M56 family metallopeptidase [Occallatibacter riparius]UWZ82746.1 M56 family metallopeptidase [Occallatibacter riparius]